MTVSSRIPVKCLLVDDVEDNLLVLEALLERDGVQILKAGSGREALALLQEHDVALALVDVTMPEMDGFELAELMRADERTRRVPIIFVTAAIPEPRREFRGYDAGAVDFLFKPLDLRILRHKAETFFELYRHRQAIAETLRLNEELMAVVGHDLRNPLNVVLMTADVLAKESDEELTRDLAGRLQSAGKRMQHIIDELFDLSRARLSGGIAIAPAPAQLGDIVSRIALENETSHPNRAITVRKNGNLSGVWDGARLEQVVANLLGNALRHGAADEPVVVDVQGEENAVVLSMHNGGHIPPELIPRLFEPFHSGSGRRARTEGLGLGLYIVEQIVMAHGGTVSVHSTKAEGTTFRVTLPRSSGKN